MCALLLCAQHVHEHALTPTCVHVDVSGGGRQTKLKLKLRLEELAADHELVKAAAKEPELTADMAATRFILVPASEFGGPAEVGGWVAKIEKVDKRGQQLTKIKFSDGIKYFLFAHVVANFKPLS